MWVTVSDERTGLSFSIAAGSCQRNHSQIRVPWDSWPYFTISDSRLPFSSPPTAQRVTVEVFDPASIRNSPWTLSLFLVITVRRPWLKTPRRGSIPLFWDRVVSETIVIAVATLSAAVYLFTAYPRNVCSQSLPSNSWLHCGNNVYPASGQEWKFASTSIFRILVGTSHYTGQHKHRINADIHALSGFRTYDPSVWAAEDISCLRLRCHCEVKIVPVPN
jgi:hypothetical protein